MKQYLKGKDYIPVIAENYETYARLNVPYYVPVYKVPLEKIKIDKSLMSFPNDVSNDNVETIIKHFNKWAWYPVLLMKTITYLVGSTEWKLPKD